jgi:hypothetical protein
MENGFIILLYVLRKIHTPNLKIIRNERNKYIFIHIHTSLYWLLISFFETFLFLFPCSYASFAVYICIYIYMNKCKNIYGSYVYIYTYLFIYFLVDIPDSLYISVYTYIWTCVNTYIYIYICIYIYIYTYVYICIFAH